MYKQGQQQEVEEVLYCVLESIRLAAYLLSPIIPNLSNAIYQQLGFLINFNDKNLSNQFDTSNQHSQWGTLKVNEDLSKPQPIFSRIEIIH